MSTNITVEKIDVAIAKAMSYSSMTTDGDMTTNQSIKSLMDARRELIAEEERKNGKRKAFLTFDLSKQNF
jgi:hypothetical protein